MTMAKQKIDNVYIADGLAEDCEELILKCSQFAKLSFEKFSRIWMEMEFATIYYGRPSGAELAEFSEEALHIAKFFMVSNIHNNFEKSVAGLFLVYSILNFQPYPRFAPLRLVQDDVGAIQKLEFVARKERRHDILYILGEVLIRGPCQFQVSPRERGLDFCIRKYYDGYTQHSVIYRKPIGVFHRHNEELDIIRELSFLEDHYENAKQTISGAKQDRSLHYANGKLAKDLQTSLKTIVSGIVVGDAVKQSDDCKDKVPEHYDSVQAIKNKAMKNVVDPIKHLTGVDDRNKTPETVAKKTKTKKSKEYMKLLGEKRKKSSESPESPIKSPKPNYPWSLKLFNQFEDEETSPQKHKPYKNVVRTSPRQKKPSTSESPAKPDPGLMPIDIEPLEISNNNINPSKSPKTKRSPRKNSTPKRIRTDRKLSFDKSPDEEPVAKKIALKRAKTKSNTNSTENAFTAIRNESQLVELTIGKLPIELSAQNNNVEIEIIDLFKGKGDKKTIKFENGRKVEFKSHEVKNNGDDVMQNEPSTSKTYKNSGPLRKNMKLTKLKSRIKRLGVVEVVDFESGDSSD